MTGTGTFIIAPPLLAAIALRAVTGVVAGLVVGSGNSVLGGQATNE